MSATNRSDVREPDDHYATPAWCVKAILPHLFKGDGRDNDLLDPCAGTGAILDAVREYRDACGPDDGIAGTTLRGIENNQARRDACLTKGLSVELADALARPWGGPQFVVANPPYSSAMRFVERALGEIGKDGTVAFLLRLSWLESQARKNFHRKHPADLYVLSSRPEFVASVKCVAEKTPEGVLRLKKGCGWHDTFPIDEPRPTKCRDCRGRVSVTTTDSAAYAWFVFGPGRGNRWFLLDADRDA